MALFRTRTDPTRDEALAQVVRQQWDDRAGMLRAFHALAACPGVTVVDLVPLLCSGDTSVRNLGIHLLKERLDARGVRALLHDLERRTAQTRFAALRGALAARQDLLAPVLERMVLEGAAEDSNLALDVLASVSAAVVGPQFARFLATGAFEVQHAALSRVGASVGLRQDEGVQAAVCSLARHEDERIRLLVLDVLEHGDPAAAVRVGMESLQDPCAAVQQKGLAVVGAALSSLRSQGDEDRLIGLLADGSEQVRNAVLDLVVRSEDRTRLLRKLLQASAAMTGWMRDRLLGAMRDRGAALAAPLVELMSDPDHDVRTQALIVGATLEVREAVPHVVRLLAPGAAGDLETRLLAAETLGRIGDPRAVPALLEAMRDPGLSMACAEALSRIRDERALAPICRLLSDERVDVRTEALRGLRRMDDARVLPVVDACATQDPDAGVRERAARLAEGLRGEPVVDCTGTVGVGGQARVAPARQLAPIEQMLVRAREMDASDLHMVVGSPVMAKVHGAFRELGDEPLDADGAWALVEPVLGPAERRTLLLLRAVDFCCVVPGGGRYRCNVYVESRGPAAAFRVIPHRLPSLSEIGLPGHIADLVNFNQGLVVIAGPSGSGKSTTLAALVNLFNETRRRHMLLLEDPIEYVHPPKGCLINQRAVGKHARSFAVALRGALRQDPDVIVVGEMRDAETVRLAIEASETGHLVIGTMHTTSAPKTVDRIVDSFPIAEQGQIRVMLAETLKLVICQTLLPSADGAGRVACFEVMVADLGISAMIRDNKTFQIPGQMQIGESRGQQTWDTGLLRLLEARLISPEVAFARARRPERFRPLLDGSAPDQTRDATEEVVT